MEPAFATLIEGDCFDLRNVEGDLGEALELYRKARIFYLEGQIAQLERCIEELAAALQAPFAAALLLFARARHSIRTSHELEAAIMELTGAAELHPYLEVERWNLLGMLHEQAGVDEKAREAYQRCYKAASAAGLERKAATVYHNMVAAMSRLDPTTRLVTEYHYAAKLAERAGDSLAQGAALNNLSREYQRVGALSLALIEVNRAIDIMSSACHGSYQYGLALCHRAELHLALDDRDAASLDLEAARLIPIAEVQHAVSVLVAGFFGGASDEPAAVTTPEWQERERIFRAGRRFPKLTALEEQIVALLAAEPRSKDELITELYGERAYVLEGIEARFKQAMYRMRKKLPSLIARRGQRYYLTC